MISNLVLFSNFSLVLVSRLSGQDHCPCGNSRATNWQVCAKFTKMWPFFKFHSSTLIFYLWVKNIFSKAYACDWLCLWLTPRKCKKMPIIMTITYWKSHRLSVSNTFFEQVTEKRKKRFPPSLLEFVSQKQCSRCPSRGSPACFVLYFSPEGTFLRTDKRERRTRVHQFWQSLHDLSPFDLDSLLLWSFALTRTIPTFKTHFSTPSQKCQLKNQQKRFYFKTIKRKS